MVHAERTVQELWDEFGQEGPVDLSLRESKELPFDKDLVFTIQGKSGGHGPDKDAYYGWYVQKGRVRFWSAFGHEKVKDIYGHKKWCF